MNHQLEPHIAASDAPGVLVRSLRARIDEALTTGSDTAQLELDLSVALLGHGRHAEAVRGLEVLLRRDRVGTRVRASASARLAGALVLVGRLDDGRRAAEDALMSPAADVDVQVLAHSALRGIEFISARYERAVAHARQTAKLAAKSGPEARAEARLDLGGMLAHADAFDEAVDWLSLDEDAPSWAHDEAAEARASIDLARGRWNAILDGLPPEGRRRDRDQSDVSGVLRPALRAHALIHLDRIDEARREDLAVPNAAAPPISLVASALVAEADGDSHAVAAIVERAIAHAREGLFVPHLRAWVGELVRLAMAVGDRGSAGRAVAAIDAVAALTDVPSVHAAALAAHGRLEGDADACSQAVERYAAGPRIVLRAQALETLGEVQAERGVRPETIEALRAALVIWRDLGARRDARRVAAKLRRYGVMTTMPRAPRATRGWDALSTTEMTVAELISEGVTNAQIADRLIVSRRTVETHVAHVMTKLDVPSRAAIARIATEQGSPPKRPRALERAQTDRAT